MSRPLGRTGVMPRRGPNATHVDGAYSTRGHAWAVHQVHQVMRAQGVAQMLAGFPLIPIALNYYTASPLIPHSSELVVRRGARLLLTAKRTFLQDPLTSHLQSG